MGAKYIWGSREGEMKKSDTTWGKEVRQQRPYKKSSGYLMVSPVCSTRHMLACPVIVICQWSAKKKNIPTDNESKGELTTTSFALASVTRLSSQYSQPPLDAIKAVSTKARNHVMNEHRHRQSI